MSRKNQNSKWSAWQSLKPTTEAIESTPVKQKEPVKVNVPEPEEVVSTAKFEAEVQVPEPTEKIELAPITKKGKKSE